MIKTLHSDDIMLLRVQEKDNFSFLHLDIYDWKPSTLRMCRGLMIDRLNEYSLKAKKELVFAVTADDFTLRFYRMVKPFDFEKKIMLDDGNPATIVAWETEYGYGN